MFGFGGRTQWLSVEQMGANYEASNPNVSTTVEAVLRLLG